MTVINSVLKLDKVDTTYYIEEWDDKADDYRYIYHGGRYGIPANLKDRQVANYIVGREYPNTECVTLYLA